MKTVKLQKASESRECERYVKVNARKGEEVKMKVTEEIKAKKRKESCVECKKQRRKRLGLTFMLKLEIRENNESR